MLRRLCDTKAFARMMNRKITRKNKEKKSSDELLKHLDNSGPLKCIYNILALSAH